MSTRSMIGRKNPDGTVTAVYCHHDGYPEYVGNMLLQYYNSTERCNALLCLGDISSLYPALGDADDPALVKLGVTKAYNRDRGEELNFHTYRTDTEFLEKAWKDSDAEWVYLWTNNKWLFAPSCTREQSWKELSEYEFRFTVT